MSSTVDAAPLEVLRVLRDDGTADPDLDPKLSDERVVAILKAMIQTRVMDERMLTLQRQGRIFFYLVSTGQEAIGVGTAAALTADDWVVPSYREPGCFLYRGVAVKDMVAQCYGNQWDNTHGRQMPVHYSFRAQNMVSISSPIGTQIVHAAGVGMAMKRKGAQTVALTYFGDGSTSSNDFHSGLNFAGVDKAPVIFVCENNGWAISLPVEKQTAAETLAHKAIAYGMPGVRVDGNDVLAVVKATQDARERGLRGEGPTLIEAVTYRMGGHSSSDDPTRYRSDHEVETAGQRDPIERFKDYAEKRGLWNAELNEAEFAAAREVVNKAIKDNERVPKPELESLFTDVYAEMPPSLARVLEEEREARGEGKFP
ncbi:MAG: thiamine pyrophosphate-dependent dehydrogenase E1 component subunit alpha [Planctomycetes bacterium]|nr:thiamine pyrophosphate-dependent dehydrogenase E1 component subunit alpha [Planctomycetota bacterium]